MTEPIFRRVVLKLSGEALSGDKGHGIDIDTVNRISEEIKGLRNLGVEVAIVVGGGNFWRGRLLRKWIGQLRIIWEC